MGPAAPGEARTRGWRRAAVALAAALVGLAGLAGQTAATAATGGTTGTAASVEECLSTGQVWLLVETEAGERMRSECVGRPVTGAQALAAADVAVTEASGGYLCTLAGHPASCPRSYDGTSWQYWHAEGAGAEWTYADRGADTRTPQPGTIEGWCHTVASEKHCRLSTLSGTDAPQPRVDGAAPPGGGAWWPLLLAVPILGAVVVVVRRRDGRRATRPGETH